MNFLIYVAVLVGLFILEERSKEKWNRFLLTKKIPKKNPKKQRYYDESEMLRSEHKFWLICLQICAVVGVLILFSFDSVDECRPTYWYAC